MATGIETIRRLPDDSASRALQQSVRKLNPALETVEIYRVSPSSQGPHMCIPKGFIRFVNYGRFDEDLERVPKVGMGSGWVSLLLDILSRPELVALAPGIEPIILHERAHWLKIKPCDGRLIAGNKEYSLWPHTDSEFAAQQYALSRVANPVDASAAELLILLLGRQQVSAVTEKALNIFSRKDIAWIYWHQNEYYSRTAVGISRIYGTFYSPLEMVPTIHPATLRLDERSSRPDKFVYMLSAGLLTDFLLKWDLFTLRGILKGRMGVPVDAYAPEIPHLTFTGTAFRDATIARAEEIRRTLVSTLRHG